MLNWFTFGVMFLTIVLLLASCIIQSIKKQSEDFTIEHLVNLQKHIIDELTEENEDLKEKNASLQKEINLMKSMNINDNYINKNEIRERITQLELLDKEYYKEVIVLLEELLEED